MLDNLHITNLGVIADADIQFTAGLNVLSGETGAGKTLILTSIDLLCGGKANPDRVRQGAQGAEVAATYTVDPAGAVAAILADAGGELDEDALYLLRKVPVHGRSSAHAGGRSVPAGVLRNIGGAVVSVHGQSDQVRLQNPVVQRQILDNAGGNELVKTRTAYQEAFTNWKNAQKELSKWRAEADKREIEIEMLQRGLAEIDELDPHEGEDDDLRTRIEILTNAANLREDLGIAGGALAADSGALELIETAAAHLGKAAIYVGEMGELETQLRALAEQIREISESLRAYMEDFVGEREELERAHARLAAYREALRNKASSARELIEWASNARARLEQIGGGSEREEELHQQVTACETELKKCATALTQKRQKAAAALSQTATEELRKLAMPEAKLSVDITPAGVFKETGADEVSMTLRAHPLAKEVKLGEGASGGELSRIMLALELATAAPGPTLIFDEIDAGIGGETAGAIGQRLAALAQNRQIIVVTHLAQVAAWAQNHLVVTKEKATASVKKVEGENRITEIARLLSGRTDSKSARKHATELIEAANMRQ
ncbi:MAG: DNA repair protein RecN [Actinomycetaceae bacterium]|nr:DNA repair protein RecN [Actinomycetaceae bacterium]